MKNFVTDVKKQVVEEIHKPARINFKRRKVILKSLNDLFQADLVEMISYAKENKGFKYILMVINCFSKFVWAFPLKTKTSSEVANAMEKVLKIEKPSNVSTDFGTEFYGKEFQNLLKKYNINHYSVYSEKKASIVERVNRTIKNMMWKEFSLQGSYKWLDFLPKIIEKYNNTFHRTIKMKPIEVTKKNEKQLLKSVYSRIKIVNKIPKYAIGDSVRISKIRGTFDKKYLPNWSTEIFTIREVKLTNPTTYLLQDINDKAILGGFYEKQLQKVKYPDVYLVEKILKRNKRKQVFVKWLGFDNTHNSWISHKNIA